MKLIITILSFLLHVTSAGFVGHQAVGSVGHQAVGSVGHQCWV